MRELSLFTGAGGGIWGGKLLGWRTVGYVEFNDYCQRVIAQRIKDGIFDEAPIFGDIRAFLSEGYADSYQGMVDVVTGGFPCQPFSVAGKGLGENDPRNMWPATIEVIRRVRPRYALLENVTGLLAHKYIERIFGDLAASGYDCRWEVISAAECGAPHKRERLWIVADSKGQSARRLPEREKQAQPMLRKCGEVCDTTSAGLSDGATKPMGEPRPQPEPKRSDWWTTEPDVGRVANGVASRCDRLKALGNGQVPRVVEEAWRRLSK